MIDINIRKSVKDNDEYAMFISFPYDNYIVSTIRELPTRYWNNTTKEWEVPLKKLSKLIEKWSNYDIQITGEKSVLTKEKELPATVVDYDFKTVPFEHQIEGFNFGLNNDKWFLGDEQGLGKTKQVIDIAVARKKLYGYKHCLIICGVNGLKWNWQREIKIHSNESGWILGQRYTKKGKLVVKSSKEKLADVKAIEHISDYFLITNVETLRDKKISDELSVLARSGAISMIAIDEIHKCKNPSSQQGKGMLKLQADCQIAMTGTPLTNSPLDLFIILKWLGKEKHAFYSFKNHYCVLGGYGGYDVVGYKNMDELQERLNEIMLRRLKDDVLDLPDKIFVDEFVEMTPKQSQIYKEVTAQTKSMIDQIKVAPNPLAEFIRMRQATGYTGILSSDIQESAKMDRMEELVEEAVSNNRKVVIFSNWTQMTTPIFERLSKNYTGTIITGEVSDADKKRNIDTFQTDDKCKFIVGTIGALGTGWTLTAGSVIIFMDEPWTMANKQQAIDRCHRIGTSDNVTIYTLMCHDTIDERVHDIVEKKGAMSDAIVDGKVVGSVTQMLDFLLS